MAAGLRRVQHAGSACVLRRLAVDGTLMMSGALQAPGFQQRWRGRNDPKAALEQAILLASLTNKTQEHRRASRAGQSRANGPCRGLQRAASTVVIVGVKEQQRRNAAVCSFPSAAVLH